MDVKNKRIIKLSEFSHEYKKSVQNYKYNFQLSIYYSNDEVEFLNIDDYENVKENDQDFLLLLIDHVVIKLLLNESIRDYKIN